VALALGALTACDEGGGAALAPDAGLEDGGQADAPFGCPDPGDPMVHYRTTDLSLCPIESLVCTTEQNAFHNACGCGCIDKGDPSCTLPPDAGINFISPDPERCTGLTPACPIGQKHFNNLCGCGCVDE
jgi:hypothetical protein